MYQVRHHEAIIDTLGWGERRRRVGTTPSLRIRCLCCKDKTHWRCKGIASARMARHSYAESIGPTVRSDAALS